MAAGIIGSRFGASHLGLDKSLEEKGRRGEKDLGQARRRRERGVELRERFKGTSRWIQLLR